MLTNKYCNFGNDQFLSHMLILNVFDVSMQCCILVFLIFTCSNLLAGNREESTLVLQEVSFFGLE